MDLYYSCTAFGLEYSGVWLIQPKAMVENMKVVSWRKVRVVVFRIFVILFVSTTFGHNLHRIEPKICGCERSMV